VLYQLSYAGAGAHSKPGPIPSGGGFPFFLAQFDDFGDAA
jgi:hypothetical protein